MQVEIWADIACPWCYIGRARFESALAAFEHRDEVTVTWRAFELDPQAPAERAGERLEHLAAKIGASVEETRVMEERVADLARAEGLPVDFATVRDGNTFDAHRVARLAATHGRQDAMEDRLMRARFGEGALVSDHDTLVRLATEVGLPEDEVRELLASGRLGDEVREDERTAAALGIRGVPFFVADRALGASGAQSPEVLGEVLRRAWEARRARAA